MERLCHLVFDYRNLLAAAPLAYGFVSTRWEWENHLAIWLIAPALCLAGAGLRAWARCHCFFARRRKKVLATTGPYAFSRNPLYVGNLLVIAGAGVASGLQWFLPLLLVWAFAVYTATIRHEERRLTGKYGEAYAEYRARVPAWLTLKPRPSAAVERISPREFVPVLSLQAAYALLLLVPFAVKALNPFSTWPL